MSRNHTTLVWGTALILAVVPLQWLLFGCASTSQGSMANLRLGPMVPLRVTVTGAIPFGGPVRCAVYVDSSTFMTRSGVWEGHSQDPESTSVNFSFVVPAGRKIAVSAFQDADGDEDLDRGALGIPTEFWATSGRHIPLSPPSWDRCAIQPDAGGASLTISLTGIAIPRTRSGG